MRNSVPNVTIILLCTIFTSCITSKTNNSHKNYINEIALTARKELPQILEKIPAGQENAYGFTSREEFANAKTGDPVEFYTLENEELKKTASYRIPITIEDEFRALATVEFINDTLHIVDFGANILAKEIQTVCNENITLNFVGVLRIYNIYSDLLIMSKNQEYLFIPLTSAKMYLQRIGISNPENYYTKDQIIKLIKQ